MEFQMPTFDRGGSIDDNFAGLLFALGLLSEEAPGVTKEMAEKELAQLMPSFTLNGKKFEVGEKKYKTAAFFFALAKEKSSVSFMLSTEDIDRFINYLTEAVAEDADSNPGKHSAFDEVRRTGLNTCVEVKLSARASNKENRRE